jgi:hypothetical protein
MGDSVIGSSRFKRLQEVPTKVVWFEKDEKKKPKLVISRTTKRKISLFDAFYFKITESFFAQTKLSFWSNKFFFSSVNFFHQKITNSPYEKKAKKKRHHK